LRCGNEIEIPFIRLYFVVEFFRFRYDEKYLNKNKKNASNIKMSLTFFIIDVSDDFYVHYCIVLNEYSVIESINHL